ncbi:MAG: pyrroloquinoline quinone biosynthesis protein PqqF [Pseudomonadaceae bacterium]|nr:pyrroloquinoline quinone biosynthesis protein PqqF [Pseudomonadaceae bacterium]
MSISSSSSAVVAVTPICTRLANGLQVAVLSQAGSAQAAISVRVAAGSHDEPAEHPGLAHFLEHLLFLDCADYSGEQRLMPFVQASGGQLNASTQARHTDYFCEVPAEQLAAALARLCAMLARPLLRVAQQLSEREVLHAEFLARGQDADTLVAAALGQALADGHGFAAFQAGSRETLTVERAAFQQALGDFHRQHYQGANVSLVLVGPQSVAELHALAQRYAGELASGPAFPAASPAALLPLRRPQLQLQLPSAVPTLHLAFALEFDPTTPAGGLQQALTFVQTWLLAESPGGLLAQLRATQLCTGLTARVLYHYQGQALWLLSFTGVSDDDSARAVLVAALQDWLGFFATHAPWDELCERYRLIQMSRPPARTPLALARQWQEVLALGLALDQGLSARGLQLLPQLLQQLQAPQRCISVLASSAPLPVWPGTGGFTLHLQEVALPVAASRHWRWQLPAANPLLGDVLAALPPLAIAAQLHWLDAPPSAVNPTSVVHGLCRFAAQLPAEQLLAVAQVALRELTANAEQVGFDLQLSAQRGVLQLFLQGPGPLLPLLLGQLLQRLQAPPAEVWSQALRLALQASDSAQMPLRQMLGRLPELFEAGAAPLPAATVSELQDAYQLTGFAAQLLGVAAPEQARITALFSATTALALDLPFGLPAAGRYWRAGQVDTAEACVVLFCPLASPTAHHEAGWRLLAHCYQGPFFQRLRSELQLGYGVFCGFRQVQCRRGMVFAVQSPHASEAEVLAHIRRFLADQTPRLAALTAAERGAAVQALAEPLNSARLTALECAELHWQQHLAGLPSTHAAAVLQALASYDAQQLLGCQQQLLAAHGGWYLLSNQAPSADGWLPLA